jgi:hypothetical protein
MDVILKTPESWSIVDTETGAWSPLKKHQIDVFEELLASKLEDGKIVTGFQISVIPPNKLGSIPWPGGNGKTKKDADRPSNPAVAQPAK